MRIDIDPDEYVEERRELLKVRGRQLRAVRSFERRLQDRFPSSRRPEVVVSVLVDDDGAETLQVEVFGKFTKTEHPYAVDEKIREVGEGTVFWRHFEVVGTGTSPESRWRDNTFWAR